LVGVALGAREVGRIHVLHDVGDVRWVERGARNESFDEGLKLRFGGNIGLSEEVALAGQSADVDVNCGNGD
jgi:hypothetical protein